MEEALDLRIHNRRRSDEGISSSIYHSHHRHHHSQLQFVLTTTTARYKNVPDHPDDDGDLVIVEAEVKGTSVPLPLSPSPGARSRSSDTDTDKSSPFQIPSSTQADAMDMDLSSYNDDAQKKGNNSRYRYTAKHVPNVERNKPTRLMCFLCDQKAKNGKTLETHIQKSHCIQTAQGRFLCCTECGFKCDFVDQLKSHFEGNHATNKGGDTKGKAYYPCSHCSRMYRKQSLLDAHMRLVNQKDMWKKNNVYVNT